MSEARLWSYLRDGVGGLWDAERIENRLNSGVPDVTYSTDHHGWVELKFLPKPPKKPDSIMRIDHFTPEQRNWITRHGRRGGHCFVFLQVDRAYMLFGWESVPEIGRVTYEKHREIALAVWDGSVDFPAFIWLLANPVRRHPPVKP